METVSFTIPMREDALLKTAKYLQDLAGATEVDAVEAFAKDTPEDMGVRIDDKVAEAEGGANTTLVPTVDSEGLPWDVRIHSSSKALIKATAAWRLKKNVDPTLVEQVKTELKALVAPVLVAEEKMPPSTVVHDPGVVVPLIDPTVVTPPGPPVEEVAVVVAPTNTYPELVKLITERVATGKLMPADVKEACENAGAAASGFPDLPALAGAPVFIPLVAEELRKLWATRR